MTNLLEDVNWKHGLKTAIAAAICLALVRAFKLPQGYWACISTIVVMQSETGATLLASRDRLAGTAIGVLMGWGASEIWHGRLVVYAAVVFVCMVVPEVFGLKMAGRLAGVAATIVLFIPIAGSHWVVAQIRFLEVSLGIVAALLVSQVIWRTSTPRKVSPPVT